jgi:hypothetical protein
MGDRRNADQSPAAARAGLLLLLLAPPALALAACQAGGPLAPDPLEQAVTTYYDAHALEENGLCPAPHMVGVTSVRPVEQDAGGRRVVRVRYRYRDWFMTGEENLGQCTGFEGRTFTLAADPAARGGWRVVDMSGPQRRSRS